ncbi:hypothetical protein IEO21_09821 [Rhodonia placenta]|uniref:C2H2-type domain-containing protein n=1 Tax=Rhodonia placenta TaxID=104341 RepID=A0A8H7TXC7_9APHY|nr:hypothetical protein IEO21_09821 [Postia placenta]
MQDRYSVLLLDMASIHDHDATVLGTNNPGLLEPVPEGDWLEVPEGPLQDDPFVEGYWSDEDEDDQQQQQQHYHHHHHHDSDEDSGSDSDYGYTSDNDDDESTGNGEPTHAHQSEEEDNSSDTLATPPPQDDVHGSVEEIAQPQQPDDTLGVYPLGDRFACPICRLTFGHPNEAKRHLITLHGKKKFQCPACDRCFNRRDAFKRHFEGKTLGACKNFMATTLLPTESLSTFDASRYVVVVAP